MEPTPIRTKKKIPAKIFLLVTLGLVTAGGVILMVMKTGFGNWGRNPFVGKVVEISGSVSAVGLVERYAKGKSIVVKSVDDNFETSVYCDLSGRHSIRSWRMAFPNTGTVTRRIGAGARISGSRSRKC